jgi:hypothetical protein
VNGWFGKPMSSPTSGPLPRLSFRPVNRFSHDTAHKPSEVSSVKVKAGDSSVTRLSAILVEQVFAHPVWSFRMGSAAPTIGPVTRPTKEIHRTKGHVVMMVPPIKANGGKQLA